MQDVQRLAGNTAEAIARGLIDAAAGHCGAAPAGDDMTTVVIKRNA
jgi:serine phosphatase RsbU (regulator of sigma subunit)